jgi:GT2 family glycosyltransferase
VTPREISTVILSWNDGELLERAIASTRSFARDLELVVVDNGSSPAVVVAPDVILIRNPTNRGVAAGRNIGVRSSSGRYVCLLDSDAELLPGSLERLVERLDRHADVALVAPTFVGQLPEASAGAAPTLSRKVRRVLGRTDRYESLPRAATDTEWDVDFAIGACQVFRREAFDQVGGLDETYFYGPEDADFCLRLRRAGWRVLQVADAPVIHPPRRRNRRLLTRRGLRHAWAVTRFLARHRGFARKVPRAAG